MTASLVEYIDLGLLPAQSSDEIDPKYWGYDGPGWYFWGEDLAQAFGPYATQENAEMEMGRYAQFMNESPKPNQQKG